jgi:hypothetical protein
MQDVTDQRTEDLARLWKEVLGVDAVADPDDFFKLGGHSLSALKLSTRIREELRLDVRLGHVFENATFGALREVVRTAGPSGGLF